MKLRFTSFLFGMAFLMFALMSNSGGRAASGGQGSTGAPGDGASQCSTCHVGGNFGADLTIELTDSDGSVITEYVAGETYTLTASVTTTTAPSGYGLQLVSLLDADNTDTGGLSSPSSNAQITPLNDRNYLEQAGLSSSENFSAEWTAPEAGSGDISFYAAGHAANGNGQSSGDQSVSSSITIAEKVVNRTQTVSFGNISVYPNPVMDILNVKWDNNAYLNIEVLSFTGEVLFSGSSKNASFMYDASQLDKGVYLLRLIDLTTLEETYKKFVKI